MTKKEIWRKRITQDLSSANTPLWLRSRAYQDGSKGCNETYVFYVLVNVFTVTTCQKCIKIYKSPILCMLSLEICYFMEK